MKHSFVIPDMADGAPILRCSNNGCYTIWWCDRNRPQSECTGGRKPKETNES